MAMNDSVLAADARAQCRCGVGCGNALPTTYPARSTAPENWVSPRTSTNGTRHCECATSGRTPGRRQHPGARDDVTEPSCRLDAQCLRARASSSMRDAERTELAQIGRQVLVRITPVRRAAGRCGMGSQSHRRAPHVTHGSELAVLGPGQRSIHLVHQTSVLSLGALTMMARGPTFINTKSTSLGSAASRAAKQSNRARH